MPTIVQTIDIAATPQRVYELIAHVEGFAEFTEVIREIVPRGGDVYHWVVKAAGVTLEWEAQVIERAPPQRFAWRSLSGVENTGTWDLEPIADGTRVSFTLEYHLASRLLEKAVARAANPLIRKVEAQIMGRVKQRLEQGT